MSIQSFPALYRDDTVQVHWHFDHISTAQPNQQSHLVLLSRTLIARHIKHNIYTYIYTYSAYVNRDRDLCAICGAYN